MIIFFASCSEDRIFEETQEINAESQIATDTALIEGHYIVVVSREPAVKNSRAAAVLDELTNEVAKKAGARINRKYKNVISGFAAELTETQVRELRKDKRVLLVEQDRQVYLHSELVVGGSSSWGLDRIDQREGELDRTYAFNATGKGVTAYVMDTGVRLSHQDLGGRAVLGYDFVRETGEEGEDCYGHGTPVAGIIGGTIHGVAKDINIVSVKVFDCYGSSPASRILEALDWVNVNVVKPAVVNGSFGYSASETMDIAFQNSIEAGIHFAVSAGNSAEDACNYTPARVPGVLTAGASDIYNNIAAYSNDRGSNYGDCVDVFGPGLETKTISKMNDESTRYFSGTSAAAPYVAGVMALFLETKPGASPAEVHESIVTNSTKNAVSGVPYGTSDFIYSFSEPVEFESLDPPELNLSAVGEKIRGTNYANLTWTPSEARYVKVYINDATNWVEHFNDGEQQIQLGDREKNVTYKVKICEVNYANCSEEVAVVFGDGGGETVNNPPKAEYTYTADLLSLTFTDSSTDSDGSVVSWSWDFGDGQVSSVQHPSHSYSVAGTYNVSLEVTDDVGDTGSISKMIEVSAEEPSPGDILLTGNGYKVKGAWHADLSWTPAGTSSLVDIYRNMELIATVENTGAFTDATDSKGGGSLTYSVCEAGTATCSNEVTLNF